MKNLVFTLILLSIGSSEITWGTDFEVAKTTATEERKHILIVFSGSDWCKPCIQLHKTLFDSEEFRAYADKALVLVKADFPSRKKNQLSEAQTAKNEALAARYNQEGAFPLAVFTDPAGKVLGSFGFDKTKSPEDYISEFKQYLK